MSHWFWIGPLLWAVGMMLLLAFGLVMNHRRKRRGPSPDDGIWLKRFASFLTWFPF